MQSILQLKEDTMQSILQLKRDTMQRKYDSKFPKPIERYHLRSWFMFWLWKLFSLKHHTEQSILYPTDQKLKGAYIVLNN
jgi:hypothetical protein